MTVTELLSIIIAVTSVMSAFIVWLTQRSKANSIVIEGRIKQSALISQTAADISITTTKSIADLASVVKQMGQVQVANMNTANLRDQASKDIKEVGQQVVDTSAVVTETIQGRITQAEALETKDRQRIADVFESTLNKYKQQLEEINSGMSKINEGLKPISAGIIEIGSITNEILVNQKNVKKALEESTAAVVAPKE